jgi:hypothetical protein
MHSLYPRLAGNDFPIYFIWDSVGEWLLCHIHNWKNSKEDNKIDERKPK